MSTSVCSSPSLSCVPCCLQICIVPFPPYDVCNDALYICSRASVTRGTRVLTPNVKVAIFALLLCRA